MIVGLPIGKFIEALSVRSSFVLKVFVGLVYVKSPNDSGHDV